nr:efflux RND transporter permease subunit [Deltaproteobacteria bacterium]
AVGIVIDDAIVVLENIYRHIDEKRMKPFPAAIQATKEIGMAVLATTLSLMAVFLPVAFMTGIVGRFLYSFGMTMAFAIGVSMVVAFTLTPMMAARMLPVPPPPGEERRRSILQRISDGIYKPIERLYTGVLGFCLRHRWIVGIAIVGSCLTTGPLAKKVGGGFLPANDEAQFEIYVQAPEGTTLAATSLIADRIARQTRDIAEVESTLVSVADSDARTANVGHIYVHLVDPNDRTLSQDKVMQRVRDEVLSKVPKTTRVAAQLVNDFSIGTQNAMVMFMVSGPELEKLESFGKRALEQIKLIPGVTDLDSSLVDPMDETTVRPDLDRAAMLGVDPQDITMTLAVLVGGVPASTFEDRGDQYPVFLRAAERFRDDPAALALIAVPSRTLGQVPITDVISYSASKATSKINRTSRVRSITISCNVTPGFDQSGVANAVETVLKDLDMPVGYTLEPFGMSKEMKKLGPAFLFAILMAFVFMYLVLAAQFESWLYPFIIMMALPLTVPYAFLSLLITGGSLNIFSMLGLLVLFGMVKKNAILQVDHANGLRRAGLPRDKAVLAAARDRLRPILMTTFAFVAGMLPLVTSTGVGSGFSKSIASIVVGGQTMSLVLTLIAIPVIYTWFDDLARGGRWVVRKLRRGKAPPDRGAAEVGVVDIYAADAVAHDAVIERGAEHPHG